MLTGRLVTSGSRSRPFMAVQQCRSFAEVKSKLLKKRWAAATPPSNSRKPEIAAAQADIFGNVDSYANICTGRKYLRPAKLGDALVKWYPPSEAHLRREQKRMMKHEIKTLKDKNAPEEEIEDLRSLYEMMALTPAQEYKLIKAARLARRGKFAPKKGMGKRAMKKK
mmetsp:Transcript_8967/g.11256  ORF Transcript_8967/g.11256 Transcript_8967/m.11256 type:complete len:167 (-) Transcript_8967:513-1013(-)